MPEALAVTVRTFPPRLSAIVALASAVPLIVAPCSVALMRLSPATELMTGAAGAAPSTVIAATLLPMVPWLPARSICLTCRLPAA